MEQKRQEALRLYLTQGKTQREIAAIIGVSDKTIYTWIHKYAWDKLRYASNQAPAIIANNLCTQLVELQNAIDRREPGLRYPTKDESQIIHRLILDIDKMKKHPSMGVTMQVLHTFRNHVRKYDKQLADKLDIHLMLYTENKVANAGPYPSPFECDNENISPIPAFFDGGPDYTQFYRYTTSEPEIPEEVNNETAEIQELIAETPASPPAETGSKPEAYAEANVMVSLPNHGSKPEAEIEASMEEIKKLMQKGIPVKPRTENEANLVQQLQHWKKFSESIRNDSLGELPPGS